jgi:hypothetical protein
MLAIWNGDIYLRGLGAIRDLPQVTEKIKDRSKAEPSGIPEGSAF